MNIEDACFKQSDVHFTWRGAGEECHGRTRMVLNKGLFQCASQVVVVASFIDEVAFKYVDLTQGHEGVDFVGVHICVYGVIVIVRVSNIAR